MGHGFFCSFFFRDEDPFFLRSGSGSTEKKFGSGSGSGTGIIRNGGKIYSFDFINHYFKLELVDSGL